VFVYKDQDSNEPEPSDWERYAAEEYELLVAEEGAVDAQHDDALVYSIQLFFVEDFEYCFASLACAVLSFWRGI